MRESSPGRFQTPGRAIRRARRWVADNFRPWSALVAPLRATRAGSPARRSPVACEASVRSTRSDVAICRGVGARNGTRDSCTSGRVWCAVQVARDLTVDPELPGQSREAPLGSERTRSGVASAALRIPRFDPGLPQRLPARHSWIEGQAVVLDRLQRAGETPNSRLNARPNAAIDPKPASLATFFMPRSDDARASAAR